MDRTQFLQHLQRTDISTIVDRQWELLDEAFTQVQQSIPGHHLMPRRELSFHNDVKLLGYLTTLVYGIPGDIVEIGVWKGKSLALMNFLAQGHKKVIGIDCLELENQANELSYYKNAIYPNAFVIQSYSERALDQFEAITNAISILHIDGGHLSRNVLLDFLLYEPYVVSGGFVLFDDYMDFEYSPEVAPAVDLLRVGGLFAKYKIFGNIPGFQNSYLLMKK